MNACFEGAIYKFALAYQRGNTVEFLKCVQFSKINSKTYSQLYLSLMSHIISFQYKPYNWITKIHFQKVQLDLFHYLTASTRSYLIIDSLFVFTNFRIFLPFSLCCIWKKNTYHTTLFEVCVTLIKKVCFYVKNIHPNFKLPPLWLFLQSTITKILQVVLLISRSATHLINDKV